MSKALQFVSKRTFKSLWQEYRIYKNRIEFGTLLGILTVPFEEIERIDVAGSEAKRLLKGDLMNLMNFRNVATLKLDWASFFKHVVIHKSTGKFRRILFAPEKPVEFKTALQSAIAAWAKDKPSGKK